MVGCNIESAKITATSFGLVFDGWRVSGKEILLVAAVATDVDGVTRSCWAPPQVERRGGVLAVSATTHLGKSLGKESGELFLVSDQQKSTNILHIPYKISTPQQGGRQTQIHKSSGNLEQLEDT